MRPCTSPLEDLAAFAIAFFCGALSVITLTSYMRHHQEGESRESR